MTMPNPTIFSPGPAGDNQFSAWGEGGRNKGDQVIYFRRPPRGEHISWITWGDSISGTKFKDMVRRGFDPLFEYGVINSPENERRWGKTFLQESAHAIWLPILSAPGGPGEFPLEQVMTFRWYRPENCPVTGVRFPQLEGKKVREYPCPQCRRPPFIDIEDVGGASALGNHLSIMHKWTREDLNAYGKSVKIDFNKLDVKFLGVNEFEIEQPEVEPEQTPLGVEVETVA